MHTRFPKLHPAEAAALAETYEETAARMRAAGEGMTHAERAAKYGEPWPPRERWTEEDELRAMYPREV